MRRLSKIAAVALVGVAGRSPAAVSDNDEGGSGSDQRRASATADGDGPKVGVAYDVGGRGDLRSTTRPSWAWRRPSRSSTPPAPRPRPGPARTTPTARSGCARSPTPGYNPIIAVGFVYSPAVDKVAAGVPRHQLRGRRRLRLPTGDEQITNVADLNFAEEQGSFLVGAAAALKTEAKNVGFVGGVNGPLIQKFEAGFKAGVEAVDPTIKIELEYLSQDDPVKGFENPAGGETAATGMYDERRRHRLPRRRQVRPRCLRRGRGRGRGQLGDRCRLRPVPHRGRGQQPLILTSMLKRVDVAVFEYVEAFDDGKRRRLSSPTTCRSTASATPPVGWLRRRHRRPARRLQAADHRRRDQGPDRPRDRADHGRQEPGVAR